MKDMNKIFIMGRLGADPEMKETKAGSKLAVFSVATARWVKDGDPVTEWHKVVAWGKQSEACVAHLKKGQSVLVEGSIRMQKYKDKTGIERRSVEIYADDVTFVGGRQKLERPFEIEDNQTISSDHTHESFEAVENDEALAG